MKKVILVLALPIMLSNLIQTVYSLADTFFVSLLGDIYVAAVGFVWPVEFFMLSLGMGLGIGGRAIIAQYIGAGKGEQARHAAGQLFMISTLLGIVLAVFGYFITPGVVRFMGAEGALYQNSVVYLQIVLAGEAFRFVFFSYASIKQAQGDMITPLVLSGSSAVLNIILDPIMILGMGLGIQGAAYATIISRGLLGIYCMVAILKSKKGLIIRKSDFIPDRKMIGNIIRLGLPASVGQATTSLGFIVMNIFIKSYGEITLAAFAVGNRINSLVLMPIMGVGNALSTVVAQNMGAGDIPRVKKALWTAMKLTTLFAVIGGGVMVFFTEPIIGIFTRNPQMLAQGSFYMVTIVFSLPLMGMFQNFIGFFQGLGRTAFATSVMLARLWLARIPLIILLGYFTNLQEKSVWYAIFLSNIVVCVMELIAYYTGFWKKKVIR
ncbi:MAG: MATE family efflux transporter [Clostridia bacterium]